MVKQPGLTRYWFEFHLSVEDEHPEGALLGCGVTARDYDDALSLLRERVWQGRELPAVRRVVEDVDVSSLDSDHVLPNLVMPPVWRGVWFPKGYADWQEKQ
jgi:hypothetical protein